MLRTPGEPLEAEGASQQEGGQGETQYSRQAVGKEPDTSPEGAQTALQALRL